MASLEGIHIKVMEGDRVLIARLSYCRFSKMRTIVAQGLAEENNTSWQVKRLETEPDNWIQISTYSTLFSVGVVFEHRFDMENFISAKDGVDLILGYSWLMG